MFENKEFSLEQELSIAKTKLLLEKASKEQLQDLYIELFKNNLRQHNLLCTFVKENMLNL